MIKILQGPENNLSSQKVWNKKLFLELTRKISHQDQRKASNINETWQGKSSFDRIWKINLTLGSNEIILKEIKANHY